MGARSACCECHIVSVSSCSHRQCLRCSTSDVDRLRAAVQASVPSNSLLVPPSDCDNSAAAASTPIPLAEAISAAETCCHLGHFAQAADIFTAQLHQQTPLSLAEQSQTLCGLSEAKRSAGHLHDALSAAQRSVRVHPCAQGYFTEGDHLHEIKASFAC
jgi:hypothetical protein